MPSDIEMDDWLVPCSLRARDRPYISSECQCCTRRVRESSTKKLFTPERNRLYIDIIESI